ncbi:MAG TPA: DUF411 domain-containing protein [Burkholderiales bacterium]
MNRRQAIVLALSWAFAARSQAADPAPTVTVYKSPSCSCCGKWVDHLRAGGFRVAVHDVQSVEPFKERYGVPPRLASCHTATVNGYVIEGHVPADLIRKLLAEKPKVKGLAVPGMPVGSPGMEQGNVKEPYDVVSFDQTGRTAVFARR